MVSAALALLLLADRPRPLMRDFIGLNVHTVLFKPEAYRAVAKRLRNYHPVEWDLGEDPSRLPDWPFAKNRVDWSTLYPDWAKRGYTTVASAMFETVPRARWTDLPTQASQYAESFARAFGPGGRWPSLEAVEIGNEPHQWSNEDYAVVFDAMAAGFRKGDPRLKIATCAVQAGRPDEWSKPLSLLETRGPSYDILNVHRYAFAEGWPKWRRVGPESDASPFRNDIQAVIDWRNQRARGKEIWVTEFGYDSTTKPVPSEGPNAGFVPATDAEQARWIVRSFLTLAEMEVDRAYLYWFDDKDEPSLHAGSGLTRNGVPKPSYHAMVQLQRNLGSYRLLGERDLGRKGIHAQVYGDQEDRVMVVWAEEGIESEALQLDLPESRMVDLEPFQTTATVPKRSPVNEVTPNVDPVYIRLRRR